MTESDIHETNLPLEVGVIILKVRDFQKMLSFYRDKLGLPLDSSDQPPMNYVRFEMPSCALELFEEKPGELVQLPLPRNNSMTIAFKVSDIHAVYEDLRRRGVEFTKPVKDDDWGSYAQFTDPEGNKLQLYQMY